MADWCSLPFDLISEIALKLDSLEDLVHFSAVCHLFNQAFNRIKHEWSPTMPWLLLADNTNNNPDCSRKLYSLSSDRCYELEIPQSFEKRCWGSSCGFVVTIDLNRQIYLFNPLTKAHIRLPSQRTMPNQLDEDSDDDVDDDDEEEEDDEEELERPNSYTDDEWFRTCFVQKAIVLEVAHGDYLVLAIHGNHGINALAFTRPGDEKWTSVLSPRTYDHSRYHNGVQDVCLDGQRIYILYSDGNLGYFNISDANGSDPVIAVDCSYLRPPHVINEQLFNGSYHGVYGVYGFFHYVLYIMKSLGNLLMVIRYMRSSSHDGHRTVQFEVYRLNLQLKEWENVEDLGDVALFIGCNHSMPVHATVIGKFKSNRIYFTDDECVQWIVRESCDMGIFDLASRKIKTFYDGEDVLSKYCTPLLLIPRF